MQEHELKPREAWDDSGYADWKTGDEIVDFSTVVQHHTAGEFIEPEPFEWYEDEPDPRPDHLGVIRTFRAKSPTWGDTVAARRRYNTNDAFADSRELHGKITQWVEIEHRQRGLEPDELGRYAWVSVRVDIERIRQIKAKREAQRAMRWARLVRIKRLEIRALRKMDAYHRMLGWRGIGYNLICFSRRWYAGRAIVRNGRLVKAFRGAHTGAKNWNSYLGISWNGNFVSRRLPKIMRRATVSLLRELNVTRYRAHRDAMATSCPGRPESELSSIAKESGASRS